MSCTAKGSCTAGFQPSGTFRYDIPVIGFHQQELGRMRREVFYRGVLYPILEPFRLVSIHCSLWEKKAQVVQVQGQEIDSLYSVRRKIREMRSALRPYSIQGPF